MFAERVFAPRYFAPCYFPRRRPQIWHITLQGTIDWPAAAEGVSDDAEGGLAVIVAIWTQKSKPWRS